MNLKGQVKIIKSRNGKTLWDSGWVDNLVMASTDRGINLVIQRLGGNNAFSLNITHIDFGTDNTAPAVSNPQLGDAQARTTALKISQNTTEVRFKAFFPTELLPNDTYHELGAFVDGDSSVNTGQMWNRLILPEPYVKESGEDTSIIIRLFAEVV